MVINMAENENKIFREKSLDNISSPEALDKYIKTTSPATIILFASIAIFLAGIFVWAFVGKIESKSTIGFLYDLEEKTTISYIKESDYSNFVADKISDPNKGMKYIQENMYMQYGDNKIYIDSFSSVQVYSIDATNDFLLTAAGLSYNDMYRIVYSKPLDFSVTEYQFTGKIVYSLLSPINLLFD